MRKQKMFVVLIGLLIIAGTLIITSFITANNRPQENTAEAVSTQDIVHTTDNFTKDETETIPADSSQTEEQSSESATEKEESGTNFEPIMTENGGEIEVIIPDDQEGEGF